MFVPINFVFFKSPVWKCIFRKFTKNESNVLNQLIANASFWTSWLNWVCKSDNFFLRMAIPIRTIFSGRKDPQDSTLRKNLFGFPSAMYGAWSKQNFPVQWVWLSTFVCCSINFCLISSNLRWSSSSSEYSLLGHSSGLGNKVWRRALSGSYSNATPAVGFHFACSLPNPLFIWNF